MGHKTIVVVYTIQYLTEELKNNRTLHCVNETSVQSMDKHVK